jgi:bifunctional non-homologous end joining protein LigD
MHVEDHPLKYADFEGIIPEGYGAGIVMLWDRGTWAPESPDVDRALDKGELKFSLNGIKLKGSWALVRTGGSDSKNWLLIKHKDNWSGPIDVASVAPLSVKSFKDFDGILQEQRPDLWNAVHKRLKANAPRKPKRGR